MVAISSLKFGPATPAGIQFSSIHDGASELVYALQEGDSEMGDVSYRAFVAEDGIRHFVVVTQSTCLEVLATIEPVVDVVAGV